MVLVERQGFLWGKSRKDDFYAKFYGLAEFCQISKEGKDHKSQEQHV